MVDPQGRSRLERALIAAVGPEGQCRTGELRQAMASHPTVMEVGARLSLVAWPPRRRSGRAPRRRSGTSARPCCSRWCCSAPRSSWAPPPHEDPAAAFAWFALPVILTSGTLLMARVDVYPYTRWASPAGQEVLRVVRLPRQEAADREQELLTAVAMTGPAAVQDARLRAALRN